MVGTALRGGRRLRRAGAWGAGRVDRPTGVPRQPVRRASLPRAPRGHRGPRQPGPASLSHGATADAGGGGRSPTCPDARAHPPRAASTQRRRPSIATCSAGRLPPEGTPPGCRVATRHGEKLFWEISRTRRRNRRWRDLSRADARELVRRARHHRHPGGRIDRLGEVRLQPGARRRRADCRDLVARRPGLRHLRHHGAGAPGFAVHGHHGPHDHGERCPLHRAQDGGRGGQQRDAREVRRRVYRA